MAMSLQTPDKIRSLQRKLYLKAKAESDYRFYLLYDKIYREDILRHAYELMRSNKGAPGVDGVTFEMIEAAGLEEWLSDIRKELGIAILLVEQNVGAALAIADYGYVLENGRVVLEGSAADLRGRREIQQSYLGQASGDERRSYRALRHTAPPERPHG